jgi:hypothetical protein
MVDLNIAFTTEATVSTPYNKNTVGFRASFLLPIPVPKSFTTGKSFRIALSVRAVVAVRFAKLV